MKVQHNPEQSSLTLYPNPTPQYDDFALWGQKLIAQCNDCQFNHLDTGADRHKLTFTFSQNRFSLNYETYSNSIWIETDEPNAIGTLEQLHTAILAL